MKAMLVIDFPKDGCKSCFLDVYGHCLAKQNIDSMVCPLLPMPDGEIPTSYLQKQMVELVYDGKLSGEAMEEVNKIIGRWKNG